MDMQNACQRRAKQSKYTYMYLRAYRDPFYGLKHLTETDYREHDMCARDMIRYSSNYHG